MKNIIRADKKGKGYYTNISNDILQSKKLNSKEFHILCYLLSLPENFEIHKTSIWKNINIGRGSFEKSWSGLTSSGFIQTTKLYDNKTGQFDGYRHKVFEVPQFTEIRGTGDKINIEPVHRNPVHRKSVNLKSGSIKRDIKKETEKNEDEASTGTQILGENSQVDTPNILAHFSLVDENNDNKNIKPKMEEPKMEENVITSTEEKSTGMDILASALPDARAVDDNLNKTISNRENNARAEILGPDEILKQIEEKQKQINEVIEEIINLDFYSKETREKLRTFDILKLLDYVCEEPSEYEARILQPKFEKIKVLNDELKKLKFEYEHYGENGEILITEEERTKFKNSKTFSRFLSVNSNDEIFYMFLDEHPDYVDETNIFYEWMLDRFIEERKTKYNTQVPANI